jgi:geranyl diphosphate synthase
LAAAAPLTLWLLLLRYGAQPPYTRRRYCHRDDGTSWTRSNNNEDSSRHAASGGSVTALVADHLQAHVLDRAVRQDSPLWQQSPTRINGDHHDDEDDGDDEEDEDDDSDIDEPTAAHLWDPLDDLDVSNRATRYWPHLPLTRHHAPHDGSHVVNGGSVVNGSSSINIDPFVLCQDELATLSHSIRRDLLGTDHPVLHQAASYFFADNAGGSNTSGKKFRPLLVHLMAKALAQAAAATDDDDPNQQPRRRSRPNQKQQQQKKKIARLAEISELIHTASLFHDDVIDRADTRRGLPAVHAVFGDKMAILAGDYLLARASIFLARLRDVAVVETMSTIIEHLVRGEVMQMKGTGRTAEQRGSDGDTTAAVTNHRLDYYLRKTFYKTGSLMAHSCKSAAILGGYPLRSNIPNSNDINNNNDDGATTTTPSSSSSSSYADIAYRYGKHVGMAFQLVDDILDYEGSAAHMGKAALSDLNGGVATAPVLFAAEQYPDHLLPMLERKFAHDGDVALAVQLVHASQGLDRTRQLARVHAELAMDAILELSPHETDPSKTLYRDSLVQLAYKVVARTK